MNKSALATLLGILLAMHVTSCSQDTVSTTIASPAEITQQIETSTAPLTMVHVWATWCDPCRAEFPELMEVYSHFEKQGVELILISADDPAETDAVVTFLNEQQCPVGSLIASELNQEFIESLSPKWAGSLPSTFFYRDGILLHEWEGKRTYEEYKESIDTLLNKHKES